MDYSYWDNYYTKVNGVKEPSKFAKDILSDLEVGNVLVELGCGNGRDSLFFAENNIKVVAIDQSHNAISILQSNHSNENVEFIADDFIHSKVLTANKFDYVYSRFTMHSITEEEEDVLLQNVSYSLKKNGRFFIEARSVNDGIYGLGKEVGRNAFYYNDHYRRFIVLEEVVQKLKSNGFGIRYIVERNNFAVYKDEDPVVIRVIAEKL